MPAADEPVDLLELLELLADVSRLRVFSALVLDARLASDIAERSALPVRRCLHALAELESAGLVARVGDGWHACPERLGEAALAARGRPPHGEGVGPVTGTDPYTDLPPADAAVLRTYLPGGRLLQLPPERAKRLLVLDRVAAAFEPGVRYREQQVRETLDRFDGDTATLRRMLLDEGFLAQERGHYWRVGGTFLV